METIIIDLEKSLKDQLTSLADQIKLAEDSLIRTKEGYLKVQGALEIIDIIKEQIKQKEEKDTITDDVVAGSI
jgi:hypothetical protein